MKVGFWLFFSFAGLGFEPRASSCRQTLYYLVISPALMLAFLHNSLLCIVLKAVGTFKTNLSPGEMSLRCSANGF